jgi:hypothetical protein
MFDSIVDFEQTEYKRGYDEGFLKGKAEGFQMGREIGYKKGIEIVSEIEMYRGFCKELEEIHAEENKLSAKQLRTIHYILDAIGKIKLPYDELIVEKLEDIRAKYKILQSLLGIKHSEQSEASKLSF